jgi:uncharacterized alpha-E superfamily protein
MLSFFGRIMLSRVADALFWMSRYVERAEQLARLLDVWFHLELDLAGAGAAPYEMHWTSLAVILQMPMPALPRGVPLSAAFSQWLSFELENPGSVLSCLARARLNARSIRGTINSEVWRELNKLYWKLNDADFIRRARESPYEFYQAVECGSALFQGLCDATSSHDEGWQFIQLGKFVERADKTIRILDVQYHLLREMTNPADVPLSTLHWGGVLRSCQAYEPYQRLHVGRIDPNHVVEFLLLQADFPRSVRFCLEAAAAALEAIERKETGRELSDADRVLGQMLADLKYRHLGDIMQGDLHLFLEQLWTRCASVSRAVQAQYALR